MSTSSTLGKLAPTVAPLDKAGASTRILLHDTQAHLEKFTDRVTQVTTGLEDAKKELITVQRLYQDEHEQLEERMIALTNRCQTELQKTIGSPAQAPEVREVSKDLSALCDRLVALDKKIDLLSLLNQTQSQALQSVQDQQSQILAALLPVLPLLQSIPLHIENARNQVRDHISNLRLNVCTSDRTSANTTSAAAATALSRQPQEISAAKRIRSRASDSVDTIPPFSAHKRRRLNESSSASASASASVSVSASALLPRPSSITPERIHPSPAQSRPTPVHSPEIPLSKIMSRSSRSIFLRPPLADLQIPDQSPIIRSIDFKNSMTAVTGRAYADAPLSPMPSREPTLATTRLPISVSTPSRMYHTQPRNMSSTPVHHASTPTVPAGGRDLPIVACTHSTQTQSRKESPRLRHPEVEQVIQPPALAPITPVFDRLVRTGTLRLTSPTLPHRQTNMRTPSLTPSSAGKPMSLKDRRALLPDDHSRNEGKRFIPLDDEDDDEVEVELVE